MLTWTPRCIDLQDGRHPSDIKNETGVRSGRPTAGGNQSRSCSELDMLRRGVSPSEGGELCGCSIIAWIELGFTSPDCKDEYDVFWICQEVSCGTNHAEVHPPIV
jgi:hypothetical protein